MWSIDLTSLQYSLGDCAQLQGFQLKAPILIKIDRIGQPAPPAVSPPMLFISKTQHLRSTSIIHIKRRAQACQFVPSTRRTHRLVILKPLNEGTAQLEPLISTITSLNSAHNEPINTCSRMDVGIRHSQGYPDQQRGPPSSTEFILLSKAL